MTWRAKPEVPRVVGIVGGRRYPQLDLVERLVEQFVDPYGVGPHLLVSGHAQGVDRTAEKRAEALGIRVASWQPVDHEEFPGKFRVKRVADGAAVFIPRVFNSFREAAFYRNGRIVEESDKVYAFWDGESTGTLDTIRKCFAHKVDVEVIFPEENSLF